MTMRAPLAIAVLSLLSVGCSTPLSLRRAQVLNRGQAEVMVSPQFQVGRLADKLGMLESGAGNVFGWGELSARFGVMDRVDVQLRVDPSLLPEVAVGYQFAGQTGVSATSATTVTAGVKVGAPGLFMSSEADRAVLSIPLQLLHDHPLGEHVVAVVGLRVIPSINKGDFSLAPGAVAALSFGGTGPWRFQPELAVSTTFIGLGSGSPEVYPSATFGANFAYVFGAE